MFLFTLILILTIILSVALIGMVLLQPSKGGGIGSAFGTLGTTLGSTFGSRRTLDFLAKGTTWAAGGLAALCILANIFFIPRNQGTAPVTTGAPKTATTPTAPSLPSATPSTPAASGTNGGEAPAGQTQPATPAPTGEQAPATTPK